VAGDQKLPVSSVAMVASPFDFAEVRMFAPIRRLSQLTGGALVSALYRGLGGAPAPLVSLGFRLTAFDRYLTKPLFLAQHLSDRDTLAHSEAVDNYMAHMLAYPGRTFGQLYHAFFRVNELAGGKVLLSDEEIDLDAVRQPVLSVAGGADVLAPRAAVRHVAELLPNAEEVRLRDAPGGHLGVLTGRSARKTTWPEIDDFLAANEPVERPPRRKRRSAGAKRVAAQPA
jgi:polyhydroxyalkanoate synthase subunit PhaC